MGEQRLRIRLANDLAEVARATAGAEDFMKRCGADLGTVLKVKLCIDELLTNIISYGFGDGARHEIELRISIAGRCVRIDLEDDGRPFNPLDYPPPDFKAVREHRRIGGLGIHLVRESMDRIAYRRVADRNLLTLHYALRRDT